MKTQSLTLLSLIVLSLIGVTGCGETPDNASALNSSDDNTFATGKGGNSAPTTSGSGVIFLKCEKRSNRSKISLDAKNVASGNYSAKVSSGGQEANANLQGTVGDEVEFDFDSESDDIAEGAVAIASNFIQGEVIGTLFDANGNSLGSVTVAACLNK